MCESYTIEYYFRGSLTAHVHKTYCNESDVRSLAKRYYEINCIRLVTVYNEDNDMIMTIGG